MFESGSFECNAFMANYIFKVYVTITFWRDLTKLLHYIPDEITAILVQKHYRKISFWLRTRF
jgi:hypothetical protein